MKLAKNSNDILAGYPPALLENWYRYNYFNNSFDISGSGVEEYTFKEIKNIAKFSFDELDHCYVKDSETVGQINLRVQISNLFGTGNPDMVMVTNGANEGLQLVVRSILDKGDEIVTLGPCYHCHDKIAESMGCVIKKWELSVDRDFDLDIKDLERLITPNTKALFLNFPHNPTGKSISQAMLDQIVDLARDVGIYLVWDAVFQELVYDNKALDDPIKNYEKTITIGTFSKAYGAPGIRFGWIIAPCDVVTSCIRQKDYGNLYVAPMAEFVASKMLACIDGFSLPRLAQAKSGRKLVNEWLERDDVDISWRQPDGGVCGLIKLPNKANDFDFCSKLLASYGVLLVPGSCFDMPGYARLGFGGESNALTEGLRRLELFIA